MVADFGCGDCKIARNVKNKVHSFDLAAVCELVTVCDMAKVSGFLSCLLIWPATLSNCEEIRHTRSSLVQVPLGDASVDIAVFCLSLMGTNLADFLAEANRVLKMG